MSNLAWIGPLAAAIALPLVFGILRALFPVRPLEGTERSLEELDHEYGRWRVAGYLIWFFIFTPLAGYFCWEAFCKYGDHVAAGLPAGFYHSLPGGPTWGLPAAYFGMIIAAFMADALLRLLLRRRYKEFVHYSERAEGLGSKSSMLLLIVLTLFGAWLVIAIGDWYVVVTPDEVISDGFMAISEQHYPHKDIVEIKTAPYLKAPLGGRPRRISVIRYGDGSKWSIDEMPGPISDEKILDLTYYISEQSGVQVKEVDTLWRIFF